MSMYSQGMSTEDIDAHIKDIYSISISGTTVSRITGKILSIAKEWQQRPLESIYAAVVLDAICYHVRSERQIMKKAVLESIWMAEKLCKAAKAKSVFSADDSLLKILYLAMMDITNKWTGRRQDWNLIHAQDGGLFCRAYARVTLLVPDVKGKINGSAALDILLPQRYVAEKAAAEFPGCRPE